MDITELTEKFVLNDYCRSKDKETDKHLSAARAAFIADMIRAHGTIDFYARLELKGGEGAGRIEMRIQIGTRKYPEDAPIISGSYYEQYPARDEDAIDGVSSTLMPRVIDYKLYYEPGSQVSLGAETMRDILKKAITENFNGSVFIILNSNSG